MRSFFVTKVVLVLTFLVSLWGFALADQNDTHGEYAFPEGDKVDTYNGILTFSRTDLSLPGKAGMDVQITRTYSSQLYEDKVVPLYCCDSDPNPGNPNSVLGARRPVESPFGMGWYFQVGRIDVNTKIIYYGDGGSEKLFYDNYNDSQHRSRMKTRQYAVWEYTTGADTSYLKMPDGMILKFDMTSSDSVYGSSNKYVVKIEDKNGNHIDIEYFPHTPFIRKIYDTLGRTIWFTYFDTTSFSRNTRLKSISYLNSNGDTCNVEYHYHDMTDIGAVLDTVTYPNGTHESYEYTRQGKTSEPANVLRAAVLPTGGRIEYSIGPTSEMRSLVNRVSGNCVVAENGKLEAWHFSVGERMLLRSQDADTVSARVFLYNDTYSDLGAFSCHNLQQYSSASYPPYAMTRETETYDYFRNDEGGEIYYIHYPSVMTDSSTCMKPWYNGSLKSIFYYSSVYDDQKMTSFIYDRQDIGYTGPSFHTEDSAVWIPVVKDMYERNGDLCWQWGDTTKPNTKATRYIRDSHTGTLLKSEVYALPDTLNNWNLDNAKQFMVRKDTVSVFQLDSSFNYLYVQKIKSIEGKDTIYSSYEYDYPPTPVHYLKSLSRKKIFSKGDSLVTSLTYDNSGNLSTIQNPDGSNLYFKYGDPSGAYRTSVRSPFPDSIIDSTTYYYNTGLPKSKVDANRNMTQFYYDHTDRIRKIIRPLDSDSSIYYEYDDLNRVAYQFTKQGSGNHIKSSKHLDEFGRLYQTRVYNGADTIKTVVEYNPVGKIKRASRAFTNTPTDTVWTEFGYDILGRAIKTINPDGTKDSVYYNQLTVEGFDALNKRAKNIYDVRGNLLYSLANWNQTSSVYLDTITYTYGAFNQLSGSRDAKGLTAKCWYDSLFRVSADSTADRGKNLYIYDKAGNLRFTKDANGVFWVYNKYDQLNRLVEQGTLPPGVTPTQLNAYDRYYPTSIIGQVCKITSKYDSSGVAADNPANHTNPKGNLTEICDESGHTYYFYDKRNRLVQKNISITGLTEKKVKYHYNYADQLDTLYYPDESKVAYQYDQIGRLKNIPSYVDGGGQGFEYTPWGALQVMRFNNGTATAINYNDRDFVTKIRCLSGSNVFWGRGYGYDATGNIVREYSLNLMGGITDTLRAYTYDNLYRLSSAQLRDYRNKLLSYGYDKDGNRTFEATNLDTTSYFYDPNTNRLDHTTGQVQDNYLYDNRGSLTGDKSKSLKMISYDYRNMPSLFNFSVNNGYRKLSMGYDAFGRRVKEAYDYYHCTASNPDAVAGIISPDDLRRFYFKSGPGGLCTYTQTATYYIYDKSQIIAEYDKDGKLVAKYIYGNGGRLAKQDNKGNKFFYHNDYLGSTRVMTDASGNKVFQRDYYPFGTELMVSGYATDYRYTGKELDQETGLYYYGARYYDPKIGRFISVDPVKDYTNPYSYVRNNPLNATDPSGMRTDIPMLLTKGGDFYALCQKKDAELKQYAYEWDLYDQDTEIRELRRQCGWNFGFYDWDFGSGQPAWKDELDWNLHVVSWDMAQKAEKAAKKAQQTRVRGSVGLKYSPGFLTTKAPQKEILLAGGDDITIAQILANYDELMKEKATPQLDALSLGNQQRQEWNFNPININTDYSGFGDCSSRGNLGDLLWYYYEYIVDLPNAPSCTEWVTDPHNLGANLGPGMPFPVPKR